MHWSPIIPDSSVFMQRERMAQYSPLPSTTATATAATGAAAVAGPRSCYIRACRSLTFVIIHHHQEDHGAAGPAVGRPVPGRLCLQRVQDAGQVAQIHR